MSDAISFAVYQHPRYAYHLNEATMIRQKNMLVHRDPGYGDLAHYVLEGLVTPPGDPWDAEDFLCRLLGVFKCEGTLLPTLTHVQSIMALVWACKLTLEREADLQAIATALFHFMYEEYSAQFMLMVKSFAAVLHTPVDMELRNESGEPVPEVDPPPTEPASDASAVGKPTLH